MAVPPDAGNYNGGATNPAAVFFPVTPSDTVDLPTRTRGIYVGGTGDIQATDAFDNTVTFLAVPAGTILTIRAVRIRATGTTATGLIGLV